jgi:hypothetical protein
MQAGLSILYPMPTRTSLSTQFGSNRFISVAQMFAILFKDGGNLATISRDKESA